MRQMRQAKDWLSVKAVADYCLVSRVTVRRWIKSGKLSAIRLPSGHYRVSHAGFRDFLKRWRIPIKEWLLESESKGKEVKSDGSTDLNGTLRTG